MRKNTFKALALKSAQQKINRMERNHMAKYGDKKQHTEKTENGTELKFTFQHLGLRETVKLMERTEKSQEQRIDELLEHVIRYENGEKADWEDFEEYDDGLQVLYKVSREAINFLAGTGKKAR